MENLGVALEDVGGLSTKDVSVVLIKYNVSLAPKEQSQNVHKCCLSIKIGTMIFVGVRRAALRHVS